MKLLDMKTKTISIAVAGFILSILLIPSAIAAPNCRQVARDVQSQGAVASVNDPSGNSTVKAFTDALASYPECKLELETLWAWNQARDPNAEFPFAKSGDPKTYPLGPVSGWLDFIFNKLFGGSVLLMFLFGWELFLMPIPIIIVAVSVIVTILKSLFWKK